MARSHEDYAQDIGAYVLGALTELETAAFERHKMGCSECRDEIARLHTVVDALPRSVLQLAPPEELRRDLMQAVDAEAGGRRRARSVVLGSRLPALRPAMAWISAAFLLGVGVVTGYGAFSLTSDPGDGPSPRTVVGRVDQARSPGATAALVVPKGGDATLRVENLPALSPGSIYELWTRRGDKIQPAGTFSVTSDGRGTAALGRGGVDGVDEVLVTRERAPGASKPRPGGPLVVVATS